MSKLHNYLLYLFFFVGMASTFCQAQGFTRTSITFESDRNTLHGQFVLPDTAIHAPVLIFLVGAGVNSSYRTLYKPFIKENLENFFLNQGIGLLYYDKRGVGKSEGKWQRTDFYERAEDVKAAIDFLKEQGRVDSTRIGVIGHSQGGIVAQIVGDLYHDDVKFIVSLAGSTNNSEVQLLNDYYSRYQCAGEEDKVAFDKASKKTISDMNWVSWFPVTKAWRHLKEISEFDPEPHLKALKVPSLFVFAENDYYVYPGWALGALNEMFDHNIPDNFSLEIIPGANHDFKLADKCASASETEKAPYSQYFQQMFQAWVLGHL